MDNPLNYEVGVEEVKYMGAAFFCYKPDKQGATLILLEVFPVTMKMISMCFG